MFKSRFTLCTLATLTFTLQAHDAHLHEALNHVNDNNNHVIKHLLKQCKHNTEEKQEANNSNLTWGIGQGIASLTAFIVCRIQEDPSTELEVSTVIIGSLSISNLLAWAKDRTHKIERTKDIEEVKKALATLRAKK